MLEGSLPEGFVSEILPVQEWPFISLTPGIRKRQLPLVRQINSIAIELLQHYPDGWERNLAGENFLLLEPHGSYIDAEAILDVRPIDHKTGKRKVNAPRRASYAIFPGLIINILGRPWAHLVHNDSSGTVYLETPSHATGANYEVAEAELDELLKVLLAEGG